MNKSGALTVKYACIDGMHFFTSGDALTKGLCAASVDLKIAFNEVSVQLEALLQHNHKVAGAKVKPPMAYLEFKQWLKKQASAETPVLKPIPGAEIQWLKAA